MLEPVWAELRCWKRRWRGIGDREEEGVRALGGLRASVARIIYSSGQGSWRSWRMWSRWWWTDQVETESACPGLCHTWPRPADYTSVWQEI